MDDTAKYLIHADFTADGVVERSDVVGAIFGQTEGLLGDDLDLRDLQQSSKVGRIDVEAESRDGRSFGRITIASSLDRVETAILAAALETISRVGPCRSDVEISHIEDVRAAKRRAVVDRAKELLSTAFDESVMSSSELLEEVRESVRVEDITTFEGLPAGPRVADSDAVIVVEGRADVLTLLGYGVKNAVAVEGTNVPEAVADLTRRRTVTAFLDGDRGGDLILRELGQVGDVDYVARAPTGRAVEDLTRHEVTEALRGKSSFAEAMAAADDSVRPAPDAEAEGEATAGAEAASGTGVEAPDAADATPEPAADEARPSGDGGVVEAAPRSSDDDGGVTAAVAGADAGPVEAEPEQATGPGRTPREASAGSLLDHVRAVVADGAGTVRLLDDGWHVLAEADADETFEAVEAAATVPAVVVVDGPVTQRVLDVVAQRGVGRVVARERGEFTKQPSSVRVHTADELLRDG